MSVNEDLIQPSSDSFWEVESYKRTVKRQDDGHKLCGDLMQLIQERADIEKHYAKSLKAWSKKWHELIEKGPEYGTTQAGWKGVLTEAERVADLHIEVKEKLLNDVQNHIKIWRGENYHKPMVGPCKETKELDDGFRKAQKPWAKRLGKVMKTKKEYHTACKLEKTATHQENNARGDSSVSPDQLKKLQDKAEKCRRDVESTKERYEASLNDLNSYNAKYMEDMTEVFNKSQEFEQKRLKFFKEMLFGIRKHLDISCVEEYPRIYHQLESTIHNADYEKDLKWWSNNHGIDMAMHWPEFEEYSEELQNIVKKKRSDEVPGIALRAINTDRYHKEFVEYSPDLHSISKKDKKAGSHHSDGITLTSIQRNNHGPATHTVSGNANTAAPPTAQSYTNNSYSDGTPSPSPNINSNGGQSQNPFGDDDWTTEYDTPAPEEGVAVRALYDYDGQEEDELSFKVGDVFIKLQDKDDQGWCTGQKDGKMGLYPDNYVEVIGN